MTPLFFRGDRARPALGLAVAAVVKPRSNATAARSGDVPLDLPEDGLVRFVAPADGPLVVRLEELQAKVRDPDLLRGRFVMAGEAEQDSFDTPFGRQPGIVIHSYVAHSLIEGHYIRRHSWWLGFAITLVFCYGLTIWCARGGSAAGLILICMAATAVTVAVVTLSIAVGPLLARCGVPGERGLAAPAAAAGSEAGDSSPRLTLSSLMKSVTGGAPRPSSASA